MWKVYIKFLESLGGGLFNYESFGQKIEPATVDVLMLIAVLRENRKQSFGSQLTWLCVF